MTTEVSLVEESSGSRRGFRERRGNLGFRIARERQLWRLGEGIRPRGRRRSGDPARAATRRDWVGSPSLLGLETEAEEVVTVINFGRGAHGLRGREESNARGERRTGEADFGLKWLSGVAQSPGGSGVGMERRRRGTPAGSSVGGGDGGANFFSILKVAREANDVACESEKEEEENGGVRGHGGSETKGPLIGGSSALARAEDWPEDSGSLLLLA